ncbi:hypothetical protein DAEQUDRAFT_762238 [Daedalea quercina L-15889]|uniref:Uncharacterized protein n=1 Tax=Daedalea quercina L-15889 TaxID=1314783 RepID=A0A165TEM2_9APHY|nr:hypothetical protein DAEQUDRAFT_762238 [Daedalea quercina L-15889]
MPEGLSPGKDDNTTGGPLLDIEDEQPRGPSPYALFRRARGWLSVTDLVHRLVLYDYSMRSKAYLPPRERAAGFRSADGKWIKVDKIAVEAHYRATTRGKSVHKKLERQASLRQADVRLVQMLESLATLKESGLCREMYVFGIIDDNVVVGQIDNMIVKRPSFVVPQAKVQTTLGPPSQKKRKAAFLLAESAKKARVSSADHENPAPPLPTGLGTEPRSGTADAQERATSESARCTIHLSDTKTRTTPELPPDEDVVSHRLQMMLYHRLLSNLLAKPSGEDGGLGDTVGDRPSSTVHPLDFSAVRRRLSLNPRRPFSDAFIHGARRLLDRGTSHEVEENPDRIAFECLDDLVSIWRRTLDELNVDGIDKTLTLEYRLQSCDDGSSHAAGAPHAEDAGSATDNGEVQQGILGVKEFALNDQELDVHLRSILQWWHGQRRPKGVPPELERRCGVCEYHQD